MSGPAKRLPEAAALSSGLGGSIKLMRGVLNPMPASHPLRPDAYHQCFNSALILFSLAESQSAAAAHLFLKCHHHRQGCCRKQQRGNPVVITRFQEQRDQEISKPPPCLRRKGGGSSPLTSCLKLPPLLLLQVHRLGGACPERTPLLLPACSAQPVWVGSRRWQELKGRRSVLSVPFPLCFLPSPAWFNLLDPQKEVVAQHACECAHEYHEKGAGGKMCCCCLLKQERMPGCEPLSQQEGSGGDGRVAVPVNIPQFIWIFSLWYQRPFFRWWTL